MASFALDKIAYFLKLVISLNTSKLNLKIHQNYNHTIKSSEPKPSDERFNHSKQRYTMHQENYCKIEAIQLMKVQIAIHRFYTVTKWMQMRYDLILHKA